MANLTNDFQEVPVNDFLKGNSGNETALHHIISKVANHNPTVTEGIETLLNEDVNLRSFRRVLPMLLLAKNEQQLQKVEAALQVTENEIKEYHSKGRITNNKLSLYLYTTQNLILNLDKWEFPENRINHYRPQLMLKLEDLRFKCGYLNIPETVIRKECFSNAYKQPYDKNLRSFEYLDEKLLDNFTKRVRKYEMTRNSYDLYHSNGEKLTKLNTKESMVAKNTLETIIFVVESNLGVELNTHYYTRNFHVVNDIIAKYIRTNDVYVIYSIAESLKQYLESREQFKSTLHRYHGGNGYTTY